MNSPAARCCFRLAILLLAGTHVVTADVIYWPSALDLAKQRSALVNCVSNEKGMMLAAQAWANDHGGQFPPNLQAFTNYLSSPALLFCPADLSRPAVTNWANFDWSRIAYQWIAQPNWANPEAICCRCRIHENVDVAGGNVVQSNSFKPGWPAIIAPPVAVDASPGSNLRFEVRIPSNAATPVAYQWRREQLYTVTNLTFVNDSNGGHYVTNLSSAFYVTNLVSETNPVFLINSAPTNVSDFYSVTVSNSMGLTASTDVRVRVDPTNSNTATNDFWAAAICVNNLKQLYLFANMWYLDHGGHFPQSFGEMTNSFGSPLLGWPAILFCRADTSHTAPGDWPVNYANTSYDLFPGSDDDYSRILFRCKVHGLDCYLDGTVPSPPLFTKMRRLNGAASELSLVLLSTKTNVLEASSNLSAWTVLSNYTGTVGSFLFYETNNATRRLYRLRMP